MSSLKEEFLSLMPKSINIGTSQSKIDQVLMIFTLIGLQSGLDIIREHILTSLIVPTFDEVFALLLTYSSTTTQSLLFVSTPDSSTKVSQSNPCSNS